MRVLVDANVFISYLLYPAKDSPNTQIVRGVFENRFTLLLPEALLEELIAAVGRKPYLAERIRSEELAEFAALLADIAEIIPRIERPIPAVTRDPKDDYLLAYAIVAGADYLVSGDNDLLVLGQVENTHIITPREFIDLLTHY